MGAPETGECGCVKSSSLEVTAPFTKGPTRLAHYEHLSTKVGHSHPTEAA